MTPPPVIRVKVNLALKKDVKGGGAEKVLAVFGWRQKKPSRLGVNREIFFHFLPRFIFRKQNRIELAKIYGKGVVGREDIREVYLLYLG